MRLNDPSCDGKPEAAAGIPRRPRCLAPERDVEHPVEIGLGYPPAGISYGHVSVPALHTGFDVVRGLAGRPIIPAPGQELLDELVAGILAGQAA